MNGLLLLRHLRRTGGAAAALVVALLSATPPQAEAQGVTGGLFGALRSETPDERDKLEAMFAFVEGLDSELPPELAIEVPQGALQSGGWSTMLVGNADYSHTRRRGRIVASAESTLRYYSKLDRVDTLGHSGSLGADLRLADNSNLIIEQSAAYAPSYLFDLFPTVGPPTLGEGIPGAPDYRLVQSDSYIYRSNVGVAVGRPRGTRFTAAGTYDRTNFRGELATLALRPKLDSYGLRGGVSRGVRRNVLLSGEYEFKTGDFGFGVSKEHRVTFGTDYSRALSRSRRATFRLRLSPSTVNVPPGITIPEAPVEGHRRLFRMQGDAGVEYHFRLGWIASGSYQRGVEYLALLGEPVLSNAGRVSLEGLVTRRIDVSATAAFVDGASALDQFSQIKSSTFHARGRYAFTRQLAAYTEYVYYTYDLAGRDDLAPGLPRAFKQHGVRFGVMIWAPVF